MAIGLLGKEGVERRHRLLLVEPVKPEHEFICIPGSGNHGLDFMALRLVEHNALLPSGPIHKGGAAEFIFGAGILRISQHRYYHGSLVRGPDYLHAAKPLLPLVNKLSLSTIGLGIPQLNLILQLQDVDDTTSVPREVNIPELTLFQG